jgi:hypothetical protein
MKKMVFIITAIFLISAISSFQPATAQEKTKEEKEKELKMQEEIIQQKKALEQMRIEQEKALKDQQSATEDAMEHAQEQLEEAAKYQDMFKSFKDRGSRDWPLFNGQPFIISPGVGPFTVSPFGGNNEKTTWDFSKSVKENSFSRDYTFDVEPTVNTVVMSVNGDCKAGEIRIRIVMPNNKTYSDILIDEYGNLNWRKSFTISEEENKDKAGPWKFQINASKATGYFKISLQTY